MTEEVILVTGAAGFIGGHLSEALLDAGYKVLGIDTLDPYYNPEIKKLTLDLLKKYSNFQFLKVDFRDGDALADLFSHHTISVVCHIGAIAGVRNSILHPQTYIETNVGGTLNLLQLMEQHGILRLLYSSSSSVYGSRTTAPFFEEDSTDQPISPYAATKKAGEVLCYSYHKLYDLQVWVFRFFTVHGPRGRPDMAPLKFIHRIANTKFLN